MNFDFTEAEQAFAEEVRLFLRASPPETFPIDGMDAGYGSGAHSRAFLRALGAQGWLSMCWPKTHGGREQPMFMKLVLMEELALAGAPFGPLAGCWQTADAIIEFGTERLRREVLPAIACGEATFWQGYSEPDAGSDLLALKTEARRDGDHYVGRAADRRLPGHPARLRGPRARRRGPSRALLYAAAWKMAEGLPAESDAAQAKAYAGEACLAVARRGHQILGAISYCEEHPLHLIHKRIQAASLEFGDGQLHLETVARAIGLASAASFPPSEAMTFPPGTP